MTIREIQERWPGITLSAALKTDAYGESHWYAVASFPNGPSLQSNLPEGADACSENLQQLDDILMATRDALNDA